MGGWGEEKNPVNGGTGTTGEVEEAHKLLDRLGVPKGKLALRVIWYFEEQQLSV